MVPKLYTVQSRSAARGLDEGLGVESYVLVDRAGLVAPSFQRRVAAAGQLDVLLISIAFRRGHGDDAGCHWDAAPQASYKSGSRSASTRRRAWAASRPLGPLLVRTAARGVRKQLFVQLFAGPQELVQTGTRLPVRVAAALIVPGSKRA